MPFESLAVIPKQCYNAARSDGVGHRAIGESGLFLSSFPWFAPLPSSLCKEVENDLSGTSLSGGSCHQSGAFPGTALKTGF